MIRWGLLCGFLVALAFGAGAAACYETTGPVPPCTMGGKGCYPLVHDRVASDGGR